MIKRKLINLITGITIAAAVLITGMSCSAKNKDAEEITGADSIDIIEETVLG